MGGIKCTTTMVKLNKSLLQEEHLRYCYMQDPNIPIGVLGMVDDTLLISNCGQEAISKKAVINLFIENRKLILSIKKVLQYMWQTLKSVTILVPNFMYMTNI